MTGNGVPNPGKSATDHAYDHYHLHHYHNVQNLNQVDRSVAKRDRSKYGPLVGPIMNLVRGQHDVNDRLSSTAKGLKEGLTLRTAPAAAQANYTGMTHEALYDSVTNGVSPDQVNQVSETWLNIGNGLTNLQDTVARSIASTEVTWQGHAGDQARQSIATLGNKSGQAGQASQLAGVLTAQQSEALQSAKNSIPKPPDPPFDAQSAQARLQTITDPVAFATQAAKDTAAAAEQKASHQLAAHIVQQYDHTVAQTSATMPAFAPAPPPPKQVKPPRESPPLLGRPSGGGGGGGGGTGGGGGGTVSPVPGGPGQGGRETGGPVAVDPHNPLPQPNVPPNQTTTQSFTPPPMTTTPGGPGTLPPGGGGTTGGFGGPGDGGMFGGPMGGMAGFGGAGGGAPGGFGAGGARSGIGSGRFGAGSESSSGAGRSGVGAGAAAAEEAAMAEDAAGRGGGAAGGMPMGAGRGGRGGEDGEHRRPSWLLETDDGIFGTDERTAPPVIGE